jgi:hypothetical protein
VSRNLDASGILVKSLTQHWSLGLMGSASSQTFRNYILRTRIAPGIEYDLFPYSESTRRMLTFQYTVGHDYHRYREVTIFGTVNLFGEFSRTRDQIYLPLGQASTEEILLRQRQLLTGYQYYFNFGFGYSFGSIFNNIVNPRFGGGGY